MQNGDFEVVLSALRDVLERDYLSQEGLAMRLGFSASHVSMLLSGKRNPGIRFLRAVVRLMPELRDAVATLLGGSDRAEAEDDSSAA